MSIVATALWCGALAIFVYGFVQWMILLRHRRSTVSLVTLLSWPLKCYSSNHFDRTADPVQRRFIRAHAGFALVVIAATIAMRLS